MRFILTLAFLLSCQAATITVCASGCTTTSFQTALNNAARGDVVELKSGETFEGAFSVPYKAGTDYITIRPSRWRELPPAGTRITTAHQALLATIQPPDTTSPVLSAGGTEQYVSSVDTGTDAITFSGAHGFLDNDPIACWNDDGTIPITENTIYYVRDKTSTTLKLALLPGGSAIDLTTTPTATRFRCTIAKPITNWRIQGIEFRTKPGQLSQYNLVQIGIEEAVRESIPRNIEFSHSYIHGIEGENGPRICMFLNAAAFSLTDSRIEHCNKEGEEGKAIGGTQTPGPLLIRNNYIAAGSINMLFGGDYVRVEGLVNGDNGGIRIEGNHFTRPLSVKYSSGTGGAGAPMGSCSDGAKYLNISDGQWDLCTGTSWGTGPACANGEYFRRTDVTQNCGSGACWQCNGSALFESSSVYRGAGYFTKNLFEIKSAKDVVIHGNIFENNWVNGDQSGVAIWVTSLVSQYNADGWVRGENILFADNIIRNSSQGIRLSTEGGTTFGERNRRTAIRNNLIYKIGSTDYPSINSNDSRPLSFAGPCDDCSLEHNTVVSGTTGGTGMYFDTAAFLRPRFADSIIYRNLYGILGDLGLPISDYWGTGNIINTVAVDNLSEGTGSFGAYATNGKYISTATTLFTGGGDYRLQGTSPYSAACSSGCDFTGTDGTDLGADIDRVEAMTSGVIAGTLPWAEQMRLQVDPYSTRAVVSYTAPNTSACNLIVYTAAARITGNEHGDTNTDPEKLDSRTGNITAGLFRQFVLGTNTALTASTTYRYSLTCGSQKVVGQFSTRAAGSATENWQFSYASARAGEYSSSADMSSPTSISSSPTHSVPVPTGELRYYREAGGAIKALGNR